MLTLAVLNLIKETEDTVTVSFKQPALRKIKYKSGQYLSLVIQVNGRRYVRPYSISSTFGVDQTIDVTVKRVPGGVVSNHIVDTVKINDLIECMAPMGEFTLPEDLKLIDEVYLWGAGSGITPLFSLAKDLLHSSKDIKVNLIYGCRKPQDVIFDQKLSLLLEEYSTQFNLTKYHSKIEISDRPSVVKGRIDPVLQFANNKVPPSSLHYICGPKLLKDDIREYLNNVGIKHENIHSEDFELILKEDDLKGVITQNVTIEFNDEIRGVEVVRGKSVLDAGLDAGLELPYSCQTGDCDTCKAMLKSGLLKQIRPKRDTQKNNEYLMCCSYPLTADVQITYGI